MKRNRKGIIAAVVAIGALAAGGAAFTANVTGSPDTAVAGFHQTAISGASASSVHWNVSSDGQYITSATMALADQADTGQLPNGSVVKAGFDTGNGSASLVTCVAGSTDGTDANATDYTCTFAGNGVPVQTATVFNISVTDATS